MTCRRNMTCKSPVPPAVARTLHSGLTTAGVDPLALRDRYRAAPLLRPESTDLVDAQGRPLANDSATPSRCADVQGYLGACGQAMQGAPAFIGYASCANLAQDPLMRAGVETLADEITREFCVLTCPDEDRQTRLDETMQALRVRRLFRDAAANAGYFGSARVFIDTGTRDPEILRTPLELTPGSVPQGGLRGFIPVEAILCMPGMYNAADPLDPWFYRPETWYALSREIHASRFLHFVQHPAPLLLKPAYLFGGIPAVQMALDYLLHFTDTRESAARLLKKFSLTVMKTNLNGILYGDDNSDVLRRLQHFAAYRDNDGVECIDMEDEDIVQINTPLSGVTEIVRQALEMLAAVWRMPVTKFLGISPGGMNATGESDMRNWYDYAGGQQEKLFADNMRTVAKLLQLHCFGGIDQDVAVRWLPLQQPDAKEKAEIEKIRADTDAVLLLNGQISQQEARKRVATEEDGPYHGLEVDDMPPLPAPDDMAGEEPAL